MHTTLTPDHVAAVAAWAAPVRGTLTALRSITGGVTVRVTGPRIRGAVYRALTRTGYSPLELSERHGTVTVRGWHPTSAQILTETEDEALIIACPLCEEPFKVPAAAAGALIDCPGCPWRGTVGNILTLTRPGGARR